MCYIHFKLIIKPTILQFKTESLSSAKSQLLTMGETHSQPLNQEYHTGDAQPQHHTLMEQIVVDIADGNEGDILDMQTKQSLDKTQPHLWQKHAYSQHTLSTTQESLDHSGISSQEGKQHIENKYVGKGANILRKSKTTPKESLKDEFNSEEVEEFFDENNFRHEIKRAHTENLDKEGYVRQEDSYEEFITKLVE